MTRTAIDHATVATSGRDSSVVMFDLETLQVPGRATAAGLAIDRAHGRLFTGCRSKHLAISEIRKGKLITMLPIGAGIDAVAFDSGTQNAFASNGDGTLSVVHKDSPDTLLVLEQ